MPSNGKNKQEHVQVDVIPLEEIRNSGHHRQPNQQYNFNEESFSSEEESEDEENIHYNKNARKQQQHEHSSESNENIPELPGLSNLSIGSSDVLFNGVVWLFSVIQLVLEFILVFWHYNSGNKVACGITCLWIGIGGFGILKIIWGVSQDKLDRLYGKRTKCVRILVNCFPWISTILTSFMTTLTCKKAMRNPMQIHNYVQLQDWGRLLLRIQSFYQAAPQSVTQLVILLEELDVVGIWKATTMSLCIITCLTNMMISNLPLKSDDELSKAAYSPYSRVFIGLRMISSFGSRTMSLALFISSFRCLKSSHNISMFLLHLFPLSIILFPRLIFSIVEFIRKKYSSSISTNNTSNSRSNNPTATVAAVTTSFSSELVIYTASVFFPFGEPRWIFWYVTVETVVFVVAANVLNLVVSGCVSIWVSAAYILMFLALFVIVPVVIPFLVWICK